MLPRSERGPALALRTLVPLFTALACHGPLARPTSGQSGPAPFPRYWVTELPFDPELAPNTLAYAVNDSGEAQTRAEKLIRENSELFRRLA